MTNRQFITIASLLVLVGVLHVLALRRAYGKPPPPSISEQFIRDVIKNELSDFRAKMDSIEAKLDRGEAALAADDKQITVEKNEYNTFIQEQREILSLTDSAVYARYVRDTKPRFYERLASGRYHGQRTD